MSRSKSSPRWLWEHCSDPFVRRAKNEGYRSRAVFKLQEIQERDRLLRPGQTVLDLGAAPGGWSQYAAALAGPRGRVVAVDLLAMTAPPGVVFVHGDGADPQVWQRIVDALAGRPVDLVISDMAPNITGIKSIDQSRSLELAELALDCARRCLSAGGDLLIKVFQGSECGQLQKDLRNDFGSVAVRKPAASRARSAELYLLARNYKG